jgi:hypothetical protein
MVRMEKPIEVSAILSRPDEFEGKQLLVAGVFVLYQENQFLDGTRDDVDTEEPQHIWLETDKTTQWLGFKPRRGLYLPVVVNGVYQHGSCGHLDRYPGALVNILTVQATE